MKKNKKFLIGIGVIFIISVIVFLSYKRYQSASNGNVFCIGAILPLTDAYSDMGGWIKNGIDMAIEDEKKKNPSFQAMVIIEDCAGKPGVAITQYRKLMDTSHINCILSTLSPVCMSLKPIVVKDGVLMIGFLGQDEFLHEGGDKLFRYAWTANNEVTFLTSKILESGVFTDLSKTAFVHMDNDIGRNFNLHYKNNIPGTFREFVFSEQDSKIKSIAASVVAWAPDCLITYGYTQDLGFLIKALRELGYSKVIYANQGFSSPSILRAVGVAGNNVVYPDCDIPNSQAIEQLKERVRKSFGAELSPMTILAYNSVRLVCSAAQECKSINTDAISRYLKHNSPFEINGMPITIGTNGEITVPFKLVTYRVDK